MLQWSSMVPAAPVGLNFTAVFVVSQPLRITLRPPPGSALNMTCSSASHFILAAPISAERAGPTPISPFQSGPSR